MRGLAREPLVHFALVGVAVFALDAWRAAAPAAPAARDAIVVDGEALRARAERRIGHAPSAAEVQAETDAWIDEEVLYREALARGLDRDDPELHQRIAARMSFVLEQEALVPEPTEAELRAWFDAHRDTWDVPGRVDFTHVFVARDDPARVRALRDELDRGAAPERLGDRFAGGRRYRGRSLADVTAAFGDAFAAGLDAQPPGAWVERRSRFGVHLVRVDRVDAPRRAEFAAARLDVRRAWLEDRRALAVDAALARIRAGWEVVAP